MRRLFRSAMLLGALTLFSVLEFGCKADTEIRTLTLKGIVLEAEGPLFSGSNTAQGIAAADLTGWLQSINKKAMDIKDARLVQVVVRTQDAASLQAISSMSLSFASDILDMQPIGVLNPVPEGVSSVSVSVADKQKNTLAFLMQPAFTVLLDCDMTEDTEQDLLLYADLEFDILLKQ